jgi:hypothetical protein
MLERSDHVVDMCHIITTSMAIPTQLELETTTTTIATDSDNAIVTVEQQDNEEPAVGEEEVKRVEKKKQTNKQEAEQREVDAGEQARTTATQSTPACFDWVTEVDQAFSLKSIQPNTTQLTSDNPATLIMGEMTLNVSATHHSASLAIPDINRCSTRSGKPMPPTVTPTPTPTLRPPNLLSL